MVIQKMPKNAKIFLCESCDFKCSRKSNYEIHLLTRKHQMITNDNENRQKNAEKCHSKLSCHCGKTYKYRSGLSRHRTMCPVPEPPLQNECPISMDTLTNAVISPYVPSYNMVAEMQPSNSSRMILEILRDNQEFKSLLIEQNKLMMELMQKSQQVSNTVNSNNITNSNNKQLNIQIFLNEHCKNAVNLSDFVENLQLNFDDLENVADRGYVEGITQIFMNGLKEMDIYTRPVHCTDVKRESVHVRENNLWIKDTRDQMKIKSAIRRIAFRNVQQINKWNQEHPEYAILDSNDFTRSFQIMKQSLGNTCPGGVEKNNDKIAKNIIKAVYIDRQEFSP